MSPHLLIHLLPILLWLGGMSPSQGEQLPVVSQLSIEDARNAIKALDQVQLRGFCEAVMKSGRKDLIELCMATPRAGAYITHAMMEMPDTAFRRELVLLMLRAPAKWWPDEPSAMNAVGYRDSLARSITKYVAPYLPDTQITYELIGSPERRRQFADTFEAAVARITKESNPAAAGGRTGQPPAAGPPLAGPSAVRRPAPMANGSALDGAFAGMWFGGALLLAAAGVGYYKWRNGRRPSRQV